METDGRSTALVLIDLQEGILAREFLPHSRAQVLSASRRLLAQFRANGWLVVLVSVDWSPGYADALSQPVDAPMQRVEGDPPTDFGRLVAEVEASEGDVLIVKRQWGAFHGTELDLQLRRRNIRNLVLGGVASNMGVESTARAAWEHGYGVILAEDAMSSFTCEMHAFAVSTIFPRLGRVRSTNQILDGLV